MTPPSPRRARTHGPSGSAAGSLERIWGRIGRPIDAPSAVEALVGIPHRTARQLVSATLAGSDEANQLIAAMPGLIRDLSIATVAVPERAVGEIRGPVLWSETLAARAASAGDPTLYVCATLRRAYDTPENRVLSAALALIADGGRDVQRLTRTDRDEPPRFAAARRNGDLARRFLDHRTLVDVRRDRVSRRALMRLRHDARRRSYRPVLAMLELAAEPLDVPTLRIFCDAAATAEHDMLVAAIDHLERRGLRLPPFLVDDHALVAGPVRYCHASRPGSRTTPGITIGERVIATPSGAAADRPDVTVIEGRADLLAAVDAAVGDL